MGANNGSLVQQVIICHIRAFAEYVQSALQHILFSPGRNWCSLSDLSKLNRILPNTVTFWEHIGITLAAMEDAFGKHWRVKLELMFPMLRTRHYFGNFSFVSPRDITDFDESQTPCRESIVLRKELSLQNHGWMKLQWMSFVQPKQ
jgi:hypothetical protein